MHTLGHTNLNMKEKDLASVCWIHVPAELFSDYVLLDNLAQLPHSINGIQE